MEDFFLFLGILFIICRQFALGEFVRCLYGEQSLFIRGTTLSLFSLLHICYAFLCLFSVVHVLSLGHDMYIRFLWRYQCDFIPAKCDCPMHPIMRVKGGIYRVNVGLTRFDSFILPWWQIVSYGHV